MAEGRKPRWLRNPGPLLGWRRSGGSARARGRPECSGVERSEKPGSQAPWAERARQCGYPQRFAQEALGHNSKAVHHAYSKHAEVTVPSLDDWEKE